jgi:hypothetical protein
MFLSLLRDVLFPLNVIRTRFEAYPSGFVRDAESLA